MLRSYNEFMYEPINFNYLSEHMVNKRVEALSQYLLQFIKPKFHKYVIYAHNLNNFDVIFILKSLLLLSEIHKFKIEPIMRDNKLISLRVKYGYNSSGQYRYYVDFHDSLQILLSSLDKLSKTFLEDAPEYMKLDNRNIIEYLLSDIKRSEFRTEDLNMFMEDLLKYCKRDCLALAVIIYKF
jgi:hypothetical protein